MALSNDDVIRSWVSSWLRGRSGPSEDRRGSSVYSHPETNHLIYERRQWSDGSGGWGPVTLGCYLPRHSTFLLNGDGFTDRYATWAQSDVRNRTAWLTDREPREYRVLIVPFQALEGAGINPETIRPIAIEDDRNERIWHPTPAPPRRQADWTLVQRSPATAPEGLELTRTYEATVRTTRFRVTQDAQRVWVHRFSGLQQWHRPWPDEERTFVEEREWGSALGSQAFREQATTLASANFEVAEWHALEAPGRHWTGQTDDLGNPVKGWGWWEERHHLGASVFSAVGEDGRRHKYLSAFDEQEPGQMYFLAQLPDRSKAETYREAVDALAPSIVHAARAQGRRVFRQGDIFAIETTLDDDTIVARARTHAIRETALNGSREEQRSLMIYGTGHTADEVVVWRRGATYIRGIMHHDPHLEDPGRQREHIDIRLGVAPETLPEGNEDRNWYLAVRNTVPRRRRRSPQTQAPRRRRRGTAETASR